MTTRRWMVMAAIVAVVLATSFGIERRRRSFRRLALLWEGEYLGRSHALGIIEPDPGYQAKRRDWIRDFGRTLGIESRGSGIPTSRLELGLRIAEALRPHRRNEGIPPAMVESARRSTEYAYRLMIKYEHAARYPWLPIGPDPPEPR